MQRLAVEQRKLLGDRAGWHVGDIAWGLLQHSGREDEWDIRTWDDRAWAWLRLPSGQLDFDVHAGHPELLDEVLADPRVKSAWGFDERRPSLERHGFTTPVESMHFNVREVAEPPELPELPDGFRYRTVEGADVPERV